MCRIGDSGGPLLIPHAPNGDIKAGKPELDLIVGITSFGEPSCNGEDPGVYASVGYHWNAILNIVNEVPDAIFPHLIFHRFVLAAERKSTESPRTRA